MTKDSSREKSLLFLLSTVSRSLEASPENKIKIRETIATLQIHDSDDKWRISAGERMNLEISKERFIFYPVKSEARYETNPAVLNRNSAQEVLLTLLADYGVQVPGKKDFPVRNKIADFLPLNLVWVSVFSIISWYGLAPFSVALLLAHLIFSTLHQYISSIRHSMLIAGISIPAIIFLVINDSRQSELRVMLSQIFLLLMSDLVIRLESIRDSEFLTVLSKSIAIFGLGIVLTLNVERRWILLTFISILMTGYILLRHQISSSLRNVLLLAFIALLIVYIAAAIAVNPLRALLIPYIAYIALHETFFGDSRNPSKLAFGVVCLAI
jgi:hypothetical protein